MSAKVDNTSVSKESRQNNDWEDEDDNWDDWGDAVDNISESDSDIHKCPIPIAPTGQTSNNVSCHTTEGNSNRNKVISNERTHNHTEAQNQKQSEQEQQPENSNLSWGNVWKPWGVVSSVLSTATEGLGNITSTVSQGLNQVIGVPDPEEMARINAVEVAKGKQTQSSSDGEGSRAEGGQEKILPEATPTAPVFGLNLVSGVTTLGSKVLNTGLDTLEGIGKKTMNILQENDPLLKNKRKMLGLEPSQPNLSEILKEAKQESDQLEDTRKKLQQERSRQMLRFDVIFENNCGLVHYEALEILSKESGLKLDAMLESVTGKALTELQDTIDEVKELLEMEEFDLDCDGDYSSEQLAQNFLNAIEDVELQISFDEIVDKWTQTLKWLTDTAFDCGEDELFAKGLVTVAETCALEMSKLHKTAELLLVKEHHSTASEVDCIISLCKHFHTHLIGLSNRFASILDKQDTEAARNHVTNLFAEMQMATQYIEKSYKLFMPILQIGAL